MAALTADDIGQWNGTSAHDLLGSLPAVNFADQSYSGLTGQFSSNGNSSLSGFSGNGIVNANGLTMSAMGAPNASDSFMWTPGGNSSPLGTRDIDGGTRFHYLNGYVDSYGDQGFNETFGSLETGVKLRAGAFDALKDRLSLDGISSDERGLISDYLARRDSAIGSGNVRAMRAAYDSFADEGLLANYRNQETMMGYGRVLDPSNPWNQLQSPISAIKEAAIFEAQVGSAMVGGGLAVNLAARWGARSMFSYAAGALAGDAIFQGENIALGNQVGYDPTQAAISLGFGVGIPGAISFGKYAYSIPASRQAASIAANESRLMRIENNFGADSGYVPNQISIFGVEGAGRTYSGGHPYLYTGHVGYSFDYGKSIYNFGPYAPDESIPSVLENLKNGKVYPGEVIRDKSFFDLASKSTAATRSGNAQTVYKLDMPVTRLQYESAMQQNMARGFDTKLPDFTYAFKTGSNGVGPFNCAIYPATLGLPIPLNSGQIRSYIPSMIQQGAMPWKP